MHRFVMRHAFIAALVLGVAIAGVYANEAEKEVRILCHVLRPGSSFAAVARILDTGELLHVTSEVSGEYRHLEISSWFNLRLTRCSVELESEIVTRSTYRPAAWRR